MMERGYQLRNALDSLVQAEVTEWSNYVARRTQNWTKPMPKKSRTKPAIVDDKMSVEDWSVITEYLAILKPLKIATKRLEGRPKEGKFGAIWEVLLTMEWLLKHLEEFKAQHELDEEPHLRIGYNLGWMKLDRYYTLTEDSPVYLAALIPHPAFRWSTVESQWGDHPDWLVRGKAAVQELWEEYRNLPVEQETIPEQPTVPRKTTDLDDFMASIRKLSTRPTPLPSATRDEYAEWVATTDPGADSKRILSEQLNAFNLSQRSSSNMAPEEVRRRHEFDETLHQDSSNIQGGIRAMAGKHSEANQAASNEYFSYFKEKAENDTTEVRQARTDNYAGITRQYYNLATDLYEYGWSQCFHFCRFAYGESFHRAIARHEHYLAHQIGIKSGMKVLDVGCGIGGPAREIVKFTGAHITGINITGYQVQRATHYAQKEGLSHLLDFVQGDFMKLPFPDNSFDAIYAIEATVHAPSLQAVYGEIFRVLKPGGVFGVYEWLMTDAFDETNLEHRQIRLDIEQGDGIAQMYNITNGLEAIRGAGFELQLNEDLAATSDQDFAPWYWPLDCNLQYVQSLVDLVTVMRMNKWGRTVMHNIFSALETVWLLPKGTRKTAESLATAGDALVQGGKEKLFTPMYLMVGKKPE
ncbi:hypothetical protein FOBRF1_006749 [Fusarium oxysporum]